MGERDSTHERRCNMDHLVHKVAQPDASPTAREPCCELCVKDTLWHETNVTQKAQVHSAVVYHQLSC